MTSMKNVNSLSLVVAMEIVALGACTSAVSEQTTVTNSAQDAGMATEVGFEDPPSGESQPATTSGDEGVANLPLSRGRRFRCLDDYLAHLEAGGAIDLPWWRQVRPGLYEYVTRLTGAQRETATREELMRRFGFSC